MKHFMILDTRLCITYFWNRISEITLDCSNEKISMQYNGEQLNECLVWVDSTEHRDSEGNEIYMGDTIVFDGIQCVVTTDKNNAYICVGVDDALPVCFLLDVHSKCTVVSRIETLYDIKKYGINTY